MPSPSTVYVTSPDVPLSGTCAYAGIAQGCGGKLRLRLQEPLHQQLQEPLHQQLLQQLALPDQHEQLRLQYLARPIPGARPIEITL